MSSQFPFHGIFSSLSQDELDPEAIQKQAPPSSLNEDALSFGPLPAANTPASSAPAKGQVAVDIYEQDNYYIIKAPIAGVRLTDLDIEISDNQITIRGARPQTDSVPANQYYLQECFWGEFSRTVTPPASIDPKKVKATFNKECILKILIPKEEKVKIVRISEA